MKPDQRLRLSDLLGAHVVDVHGKAVGPVRDVRLVQDGPLQANQQAALRVDGLIVGRRSATTRLGYDRARVRGPWLVSVIAKAISRGTLYVPWTAVRDREDGLITLAVSSTTLASPPVLPDPPRSADPQ